MNSGYNWRGGGDFMRVLATLCRGKLGLKKSTPFCVSVLALRCFEEKRDMRWWSVKSIVL